MTCRTALRPFTGKFALVLLDTREGYVKRYVKGRPGHALLTDVLYIRPWEPVLSGEVGIDPEKLNEFRLQPGATSGLPEAA